MLTKVVDYSVLYLILNFVYFVGAKKERAHYIHPCSKSAPDFDQCCLAHGIEAIPYILQGDKKYNVPNMLPFVVSSANLATSDIKIGVKDLHVYGFDTYELHEVKFDLDNKKVSTKLTFHKLTLLGEYTMDGKIMLLLLQGSGRCNFTTDDVNVHYMIDYRLDVKEGDEYFAVDKAKADVSCAKVYVDIENLFGGNEELGRTTNKVLNDNWETVLDAIRPVLEETVVQMGNTIINGFAGTVPFKDVFLD